MFDTTATAAADGPVATDAPVRLSERSPDAAVVADLERSPDPGASGFERLERIGAFERVISRLQALQSGEIAGFVGDAETAMAEWLARHDPTVDPPLGVFDTPGDAAASAVAEVRLMLGLTGRTMWNRVGEARRLHDPLLAPTAELARAGLLTRTKCTMITDAAADLDPARTAQLQDRVLTRAPSQTTGQLGAAIRRFLVGLSDDGAPARRRERKDRGRAVAVQPEPDGMATLRVFLPAAAATGVYAVLDQHARGCGSADPRGMDARRADALVDLVLRDTGLVSQGTGAVRAGAGRAAGARDAAGTPRVAGTAGTARAAGATHPLGVPGEASGPAGGPMPTVAGVVAAPPDGSPFVRNTVRVHIHVTVPLDTLTGAGDEPAELAGHGPIPAADARALAFDPGSVWDRLVTDPVSGAVLEYGTTRYRPPERLARFVRARHGTCGHPGCRTAAHRCDIDHVVPFGADRGDGPTCAGNTCPLCRSHHRLKHMPGWHVTLRTDGTTVWTTPSGHTYTAPPDPVGTVARRTDEEAGRRRGPSAWVRAADPAARARSDRDVAEAPF